MTGMNAARHRVTNWTFHKDTMKESELSHEQLSFPLWNVNGIDPEGKLASAAHADPLPRFLQDAGYATIHVGKAHLAAIGTPGEDPRTLGFDINMGGHAAGAPGSYEGEDNFGNRQGNSNSPWAVPGLEKYHGQKIFLTEALTQQAKEEMDKARSQDKPFFLYMSHYAVHTPIMPDDRYVKAYLDRGLDPIEASYASLLEGMDKSLGDLMNYLEQNDIVENTIVLFMSDNGGLSVFGRGGEANTHNQPLSSGKGSIHEGGIRVPMIVKWPGVTAANSRNENYLIIEDFFPTILQLAGIENYQTAQVVDGVSIVPLLKSPHRTLSNTRPLYWHFPNQLTHSVENGAGFGAYSAVRQGDWKFIYYHLDQKVELFNLANDIGETQNLAENYPHERLRLATLLGQYLRRVKAQMPRYRETNSPVPFPDEISDIRWKEQ
jgi:arylsulfatase A-like enzyme